MISLHPEGNFGVVLPSDPLEHFRHSGGRYGSRPRQSGLEGGSIVTVTVAEILVIIVQLVVDQTMKLAGHDSAYYKIVSMGHACKPAECIPLC